MSSRYVHAMATDAAKAEAALSGRTQSPRGNAVLLLCFAMLMLGAGPVYYAYGNYAVALAGEYHAPRATIYLGYTAAMLVGSFGSIPIGMVIDRLPVHRIAAAGAIGTALGFVAMAFAGSIGVTIAIFSTLIAMADNCMGNVVTNYLLSHWFQRRRSFAIGLSVLGASVAAIIFPPLTALLIESAGLRPTFLIYAGAFAALAVPVWWLARLPESPPAPMNIASHGQPGEAPLPLREIARRPGFWVVSIVVSAMLGANSAIAISMVGFATTLGFGTMAGSTLLSIAGLAAILGKVGFGFLGDVVSKVWALRAAAMLQIAGLAILSTASNHEALVSSVLAFGLGVGAMMPVWGAALAAEYPLSTYGRVLGWSRAVMAPITLGCPLAAGLIFDRTGDYRMTWMGLAGLLVLVLIGTFYWRQSDREGSGGNGDS